MTAGAILRSGLILLAAAGSVGCGDASACQGAACGTGGGAAAAAPCSARFLGDYDDLQQYASPCAMLVDKAKGFDLAIAVSSPKIGAMTSIHFDLGASPEVGPFTPATLSSWSAISADSATCVYEAGDRVVPPGSFTLTLTAVDGEAGVAHGEAEVLESVHAPPGKDCGNDDYEQIDVKF